MKISPLLVYPLALATHTFALSWPLSLSFPVFGSRPRSSSTRAQYHQPQESWLESLKVGDVPGLSRSEMDSLFMNTQSLNPNVHKPDCFKRTAARIRSLCGNIDSEGMGADERVRAAISMTLCELNTAQHLPPLECAVYAFSASSSSYGDEGPDQKQELENSQAPCVSALSRSPQSWSSYSGYLREVPQLCYAFRRWNDIDTARKIYTNATLEKLSLLRHLHQREERWEDGMEGWVGIVKDLRDVLETMRISFDNREEQLDRFEKRFEEKLVQSLTAVHKQEEAGYIRSLSRVDEVLDGVVGRHEQTLLMLLPSLERALSSYLSEVLARNVDAFEFGNQILRERWAEVEGDLVTMHDSIKSLSLLSITLGSSLKDSQAMSHSILNTQLRMQSTVVQMGELARDEMGKINETAVGVIGVIIERQKEKEFGWKAWNLVVRILGWAARAFWGADHVYIDQLDHLPLPRIALSFVTFLWYLFRLTFSSFMSVLVVLISSKRVFSGFFLAPHVVIESQSPTKSQVLFSPQPCHPRVPIPSKIPTSPQIVHCLDLDPRLRPIYIRTGPRFSRIPDRLCKPQSETSGDRLSDWR